MYKLQALAILACLLLPAQSAGAVLAFDYDLLIIEELHVAPGSHVNVPAWIRNTGTSPFTFRHYDFPDHVGNFVNQFSDLTVLPGEEFGFTFLNMQVFSSVSPGDIFDLAYETDIVFPDGTRVHRTPTTPDPSGITKVVIDTSIFGSTERESAAQFAPFEGEAREHAYFITIGWGLGFVNEYFADISLGPSPTATELSLVSARVVPEPSPISLISLALLTMLPLKYPRIRHLFRGTSDTF